MVTRNEHPPQAQEFHLVLALSQRGKFSEITQISTLKLIRYLNRHAKKGADDDRDDQTVRTKYTIFYVDLQLQKALVEKV